MDGFFSFIRLYVSSMLVFRYKNRESYEKDRRELVKQIPVLVVLFVIMAIFLISLAYYYESNHFKGVHWHNLILTHGQFLKSLVPNFIMIGITIADTYLYFTVALIFALIGYFTVIGIIGD